MTDYKYNIVICACARDEGDYIQEWIDYHSMIGVEHFYIYDHMSKMPLNDILKGYDNVTVIEWNEEEYHANLHFLGTAQYRMYNDFFMNYSQSTKWVAYIDIDEFIVLKQHEKIHDFLNDYNEEVGAISLNWVLFGSNGKQRQEPKNVIERFTKRGKGVEKVVKTISRTECIEMVNDMHMCKLKKGYKRVSPNGDELVWWDSMNGKEDIACIFHYAIKSMEEIDRKVKRGWPVAKNFYKKASYISNFDKNDIEDTFLLDKIKQTVN